MTLQRFDPDISYGSTSDVACMTECSDGDYVKFEDSQKVNTWQPIATAPKDGTEILAWPVEDSVGIVYFGGSEWQLWGGYSNFDIEPTHWQPLPEPPEDAP
jgi:hypothetical protein